MALARLYDFTPSTLIQSQQVDDEFNQLVNLLNGTSTSVEALITLSHGTNAPLRLNQTGAGPVALFAVNGSNKAAIQNDGDIFTTANFCLAANDPATATALVSIQRGSAGVMILSGMIDQQAAARTTGSPNFYARILTPADTTLGASTESRGVQIGGDNSAATVTRQFSTGALTTQREVLFVNPTYGFVGASTLTNAATVAIAGAPVAGTNATITNAYALWVQAGRTQLDGAIGLTLGSDATGDIYYRNSSGLLARLGVGTDGHVLTLAAGLPTWAAGGGGGSGTVNTGAQYALAYYPANGTTVDDLANLVTDAGGGLSHAASVRNASAPTFYHRIVTPADTALTASTECVGIQLGGNTSAATVTREFATGALTTQREYLFVKPTYGFVGASTLTSAATVAITGAPAAGTNATITTSYALWVQAGRTQLDGPVGWTLGSDATGDVYYRASSGLIARLGVGSNGDVLTLSSGLPAWSPPGAASMAIGSSVTSGTTGSILFVGAGPVLAQDNANLFWDDTNNRLGLGTTSPQATFDLGGLISAASLPTGLTTLIGAFSCNTDTRAAVLFKNTNAGTTAEFRFAVTDNAGDPVLFLSMPSSNNTVAAYGVARNEIAHITLNGTTVLRDLVVGNAAAKALAFGTSNALRFAVQSGGNLVGASGQQYSWNSSSTDPRSTAPDTGLARVSAGVTRFTNGSTGIGLLQLAASGVTATAYPLDIRSADTGAALIRMQHTSTSGFNSFDFFNAAGTQVFGVGFGNSALSAPFTSVGYLSAINGTHLVFMTAAATTNTARWAVQNGGNLIGNSAVQFGWVSSSTDPTGSIDTGLIRSAAGKVRVVSASSGVGVTLTGVNVAATASGPLSVGVADSFTVFTNEGATAQVEFTLPSAAANLQYTFIVQDADGIKVTANTGDTIRIAGSVTAAAGNVTNNTIGGALTLVAINATEWIATSVIGTWS